MLVGMGESGNLKTTRDEALNMAYEQGMDLVQLSLNGDIAVCKIMSYSKFLYDQKKKEKHVNKVKQELKEVRLSDSIAENDIKTKVKTACRILSEGDKVKVTITYKGRLVSFISRGIDKLKAFEALIDIDHTIDRQPKIEGNRVYMILSPISNKN